MFWRFGGYANISTLDSILDKPDVTLEELLDESDLIQELKQHNTKLIEYLRDEDVLRRLLEYVVAPPIVVPEDDENEDEEPEPVKKTFSPVRSLSLGRTKDAKTRKQEEREEREKREKTRQKYAYVAHDILSSETWSIIEALMENRQHLCKFWEFLRQEPGLDPVTAGYFTKVNEMLLDKKTEETLEFVKSLDGIVPTMLQHVDCPMIMDLLLKIISMERAEGGQGIIEWLQGQNLIPSLLDFLGEQNATFTQTSAGDFIKAIITISANASQNEQSCIGPNSLTRQLVSGPCIERLISDMLKGGNPLTVGVGIIIEVIRKNNSDYDPDVGTGPDAPPSSSDPIYLGTLLRLFATHVSDFSDLILSPNHTVSSGESARVVKRKELKAAFGKSIEPLGFDRFKTCELMAELLHCSNMGLLNEKGSDAIVRRRDQERERLKLEGTLPRTKGAQVVAEGSMAGRAGDLPIGRSSGSPEGSRRLEIANSAEDDGFEDVGTSADISDEIDDSFDMKSSLEPQNDEAQPLCIIRSSESRLSLDDEFFDEPLASPTLVPVDKSGLQALESSESHQLENTENVPSKEPETGNTGTDARGSLEIISNLSPQERSVADHLVDEINSQLSPLSTSEAPPLPHRNNLLVASESPDPGSPRGLSPHPEDEPAPLFFNEPEGIATKEESARAQENDGELSQVLDGGIPRSEEDSIRTVNSTEKSSSVSLKTENDIDGQPMVGDFLKMKFVEHKIVPTILDFFFRFPWNNFLHNVVYDVVQQVFNGPMDRGFNRYLAFDLFRTGRITERIIEGQLRSDEAHAHDSMRLGYMGHLTLIAEEVVKFSERHPPELLSDAVLDKITSRLWSDYIENTLAETRERDNAILGGIRPDVAGGPRQAVLNAVNAAGNFSNNVSSVLANAGLTGGTGTDTIDHSNINNNINNNAGNGFLSGGSLLSGFGSSSDEEDEDMEEIIEHEHGAERSTDQYPSYRHSSLSALSIFSPSAADMTFPDASTPGQNTPSSSGDASPLPPPLNIPPSRARRQLAARLARHNNPAALSMSTADDASLQHPSTGASQSGDSGKQPTSFDNILGSLSSDPLQDPWACVQSPDVVASNGLATARHGGETAWLVGSRGKGDVQHSSSDWVDFEGSDDEEQNGLEEEEMGEGGGDIPIKITMVGDERGDMAGRMNALFNRGSGSSEGSRSGSGSGSGSGSDNSEDQEPQRGRAVREARIRGPIEDEE